MVFTAPDYFPLLTRQFHKETQWDESNSYSSFCRTSQAILDFAIPYGVSVSTGRGISNSLYSQLAFSMIPSRASSVGYLATSRTLPILQQSSSSQVIAAGAANTTDQLRLVSSAMPGSKGDIALASNNGAETGTEAVLTGFQPSPKQPLSNSETTSHPSLLFSSASAPGFSQCCTFEAIRQQALDQQSSQDLLQNIRAGIWKCNWGASGKKPSSKAPCGDEDSYVGDYLLVAQMYPSVASVTGSYISRRSKSSEIVVSGVSVAGPQPDLQLVLQHAINHRRWSTEATFGTSGKLIGLRGQYNFGDISSLDSAAYAFYNGSNEDAKQVLRQKPHGRFSVGSEVYYGIQDSSGGISIGARYRYDLPLFSDFTCVLNPIMGHVSLGWAQELRPGLCTAARYDFNMFSLNSDLAMGVEWQLDQNSIIKARWSDSQGLRCLLDARLNNMVFSMGLAFNKDTDKPSDPAGGAKSLSQLSAGGGSSGAGGVTRLIRSFGLQFQWFL